MPIFQDSNGLAIKFFIQKDIPQEIQAELCETITSLGGRVESKVPRQGYILVQPGTPEEERLRQCWSTPERPERYIVPYTYVEACKIAGMHLKQIFVEPDLTPVRMHIHHSIANINARAALASRILHSGGDPDACIQTAQVILADPNTEVFQALIKEFQYAPGKRIESFLWVKKCIEKGSMTFTPLVYKNPGGRRPGEERTQFTEEDEMHLCQWIAQKIPYKETGGRTGNRLYQQLCEQNDPEYSWVKRHTWQSWRERYKKNAARLDVIIAQLVDQKNIQQGEQGQYNYVRQPEEKSKRTRRRRGTKAEGGSDEEDINGVERLAQLPVLPMPPSMQSMQSIMHLPPPPHTAHHQFSNIAAAGQPQPNSFPAILASHSPLALHPSHPPPPASSLPVPAPNAKTAMEEELQDNEESQWPVRIGNDPPPMWAKRKAEGGPEDTNPSKRQKPNGTIPPQSVAQITMPSQVDQESFNANALVALAGIHVIDQGLRDIAVEFRFTLEEVQEYYDKCGEMSRTRRRFQKMRELLKEKFVNDEGD